jgi:hypothetical protein
MIRRLKIDQTVASIIVLGMFVEEMIPRAKLILARVGVCLVSLYTPIVI